MKTKYEEIVNVERIGEKGVTDISGVLSLAKRERIRTASQDKVRRMLLCIDMQKDFMEGGTVPVPNSKRDVENITRFIYNNMENITQIICSMDAHIREQIFHPCWWVNKKGENPEPYTKITYEDVINGKWRTANMKCSKKSKKYLKKLEESGKKKLCVWPYHCLRGTDGYTLENEFAKMIRFHSLVRITNSEIIQKGQDRFSEMYGVVKPEVVSDDTEINLEFLKLFRKYDEIYIVGEAASHCVLETVMQICEYFKDRLDILSKIKVLTDCTSPIKGFEEETNRKFDMLRDNYGIKFMKSTDVQMVN